MSDNYEDEEREGFDQWFASFKHEVAYETVNDWLFVVYQQGRASMRDECVNVLQKIIDGEARTTLKSEQCAHGQYGYEHCENCLSDYAEQAIKELP